MRDRLVWGYFEEHGLYVLVTLSQGPTGFTYAEMESREEKKENSRFAPLPIAVFPLVIMVQTPRFSHGYQRLK